MKQSVLVLLLLAALAMPAVAQSLSERVVPNDPDDYSLRSSVHDGAGQMEFTELIGREELSTNFRFLHVGLIHPGGGIGHHFHHTVEETYVILNGEAEFTVDGRTSRLEGPVMVPNKMGQSHALYNTSDEPLRWLNFAVSLKKGQGSSFDLGDDRVGAALDPVPVFVYSHLDRELLRPGNHPHEGDGALHRRALGPEIFGTSWNHIDHVILPAGTSSGPRQMEGIEEVYYVISGSGTLTVNDESTPIRADVAFPGFLGETITLTNEGSEALELLVIGISAGE